MTIRNVAIPLTEDAFVVTCYHAARYGTCIFIGWSTLKSTNPPIEILYEQSICWRLAGAVKVPNERGEGYNRNARTPACRLGRVIAWLEELAGSELDRTQAEAQAAGGSGAHFAPGEGMPRETLVRMEQSAVLAQMRLADNTAIVSQLDPDAPTR